MIPKTSPSQTPSNSRLGSLPVEIKEVIVKHLEHEDRIALQMAYQFSKKILYTSVKVNTRDPIDPNDGHYTRQMRLLLSTLIDHPEAACNIMHAELLVFDEDPKLVVSRRDRFIGMDYFHNTGKPTLEDDDPDFDLDDYVIESNQPYDNKLFLDLIETASLSESTKLRLKRGVLQDEVATFQALVLLQLPNLNSLVIELSSRSSCISQVIKEQAAALPVHSRNRNFTALEHLDIRPVTGWKQHHLSHTKLPIQHLKFLQSLQTNLLMLKPSSLGSSPNLSLTSLTFNNSLHQMNNRFIDCEALLAAFKNCPNLERLSITKFFTNPVLLQMLIQALKACQHSVKSFILLKELEGPGLQNVWCGFSEGVESFTKLEELEIDCGLLLYNFGQATVGRLPESIQKVHVQGMTREIRPKLLSWLEELATARLKENLPNLKAITYSIPGDHIPEQATFNNHLSVERWTHRQLEAVGIKISRGVDSIARLNKPQVTDSDEIVEEWNADNSEGNQGR
jgi:hypothetical protein